MHQLLNDHYLEQFVQVSFCLLSSTLKIYFVHCYIVLAMRGSMSLEYAPMPPSLQALAMHLTVVCMAGSDTQWDTCPNKLRQQIQPAQQLWSGHCSGHTLRVLRSIDARVRGGCQDLHT